MTGFNKCLSQKILYFVHDTQESIVSLNKLLLRVRITWLLQAPRNPVSAQITMGTQPNSMQLLGVLLHRHHNLSCREGESLGKGIHETDTPRKRVKGKRFIQEGKRFIQARLNFSPGTPIYMPNKREDFTMGFVTSLSYAAKSSTKENEGRKQQKQGNKSSRSCEANGFCRPHDSL